MELNSRWYLVDGINPEPWTASEGSIGRKNGKLFVQFHKPAQLRVYQESIKEYFQTEYPDALKATTDVELEFYFWRQLPAYRTEAGKQARKHHADVTNLQKAIEDALQGILYDNDKQVRSAKSTIIEQGGEVEPKVLIGVHDYLWIHHWPLEKVKALTRKVPPRQQESQDLPEDYF